jgi:hypothetical protein
MRAHFGWCIGGKFGTRIGVEQPVGDGLGGVKISGLDRGQKFRRVPVRKQIAPFVGCELGGELLYLLFGDVHGNRFSRGRRFDKRYYGKGEHGQRTQADAEPTALLQRHLEEREILGRIVGRSPDLVQYHVQTPVGGATALAIRRLERVSSRRHVAGHHRTDRTHLSQRAGVVERVAEFDVELFEAGRRGCARRN